MNKKIIKKSIVFVLIINMCIILIGCNKIPEGVSKEIYNDALLGIQIMQKIGNPKYNAKEYLKQFENVYAKYCDKYMRPKDSLISKEYKIIELMCKMQIELELYVEDDRALSWADDITKYLRELSSLLELDLRIIFEGDKFEIKGI